MRNLLPFLLSLLTGCAVYEKKEIDWMSERGQATRIELNCLDDAANLALVGNRPINEMRLKAANSKKAAKEEGWWEDPELDVDFIRIVNPSSHPFLGGGSLKFSVPLSGALALKKESSLLYAESEAAEIKAAEQELAAESRIAIIRLLSAREKTRLLKDFANDERITKAILDIKELYLAGEIPIEQKISAAKKIQDIKLSVYKAEKEEMELENAFIKLSGLWAGSEINLNFTLDANYERISKSFDPLSLVNHPKVKAHLLSFGASEKALHAEIRKQFPELKAGPGYSSEEGLDRFGIGAGITLPLWNKNKKGISEAKGERDATLLKTTNLWKNLVNDLHAAQTAYKKTIAREKIHLPSKADADALADAGEITPLDYISAREEIYSLEMLELERTTEIALAAQELTKFNLP